MSKLIDDKTTKQVAGLIKIHIPDTDIPTFTSQLNTVLNAVEVLQELDTESVIETSQTHGLENVLRPDESQAGLDMSSYPNTRNFTDDYFQVTKFI